MTDQKRVIYLKNKPDFPMSFPYYWKVFQKDDETTFVLTIKEESIEVEKQEDFFEHVSFIKNTLCSDSECVEITQEEFDEFYKKTVDKINIISAY